MPMKAPRLEMAKERELKCESSALFPLSCCVSKVSIFKKVSVPTFRHKLRTDSKKSVVYQLDQEIGLFLISVFSTLARRTLQGVSAGTAGAPGCLRRQSRCPAEMGWRVQSVRVPFQVTFPGP